MSKNENEYNPLRPTNDEIAAAITYFKKCGGYSELPTKQFVECVLNYINYLGQKAEIEADEAVGLKKIESLITSSTTAYEYLGAYNKAVEKYKKELYEFFRFDEYEPHCLKHIVYKNKEKDDAKG